MSWPTMWRHNSLQHAGIEVTPHALNALALWNKSTPTEPWTLNPIGIPSQGFMAPRALNTLYAAFPTWQAFYKAFTMAIDGSHGGALRNSLTLTDNLAAVWRAVSDMQWPASATEQDYPSAILDSLEQKYRDAWDTSMGSRRATSGNIMKGVPSSSQMRTYGAPALRVLETMQSVSASIKIRRGRI